MKPAHKLLLLSGPVAVLAYWLTANPQSVDHPSLPENHPITTANPPTSRTLTKPTTASSQHYPQPSSGTPSPSPSHSNSRTSPANHPSAPSLENSTTPTVVTADPLLRPNPTRPFPEQLPPPPTLRPIRPPTPLPPTPDHGTTQAKSTPSPEPTPQHELAPPDTNTAQGNQPIVELELPPQSQLPAVLANPAPTRLSSDSANKNAPSLSEIPLRPNPASLAEDNIIQDFLTNANQPLSPGETNADQDANWDTAARLADERYRSLAGKEAYLKRSLDAGRLSKQLPATND